MATLSRSEWLTRRFFAGLRDETERRQRASAIVFAPHQDDETLGCAGTVSLKRQAGARVVCVFMTDGSTSHQQFVPAQELAERRQAEARAATRELGVEASEVHFLGFPDGRLASESVAATARVRALLESVRPSEVYVPYRRDGLADHEATYEIVVEACREAQTPVDVCEYPIWAWNRWPWVSVDLRLDSTSARALTAALRQGFGLRMFREIRSGVRVDGVKEQKLRALRAYESQMRTPDGIPDWPTLADVSNGTFLDCFLGDFEAFRCTSLGTGAGGAGSPPSGRMEAGQAQRPGLEN